MKRRLLWLVCLFWSFPVPTALAQTLAPQALAPWMLTVGEQRLWRLPHLTRFHLSSSCIHGKSVPEGILLHALRPCTLELTAFDPSPKTRVIHSVEPSSPQKKWTAAERALIHDLGLLEETQVFRSPGSDMLFVLRGQVEAEQEAQIIQTLTVKYPSQISNETILSDGLLASLQNRIDGWLKNDPKWRESLWTERVGSALFVRGHLANPVDHKEALRELAVLGSGFHVDISNDAEASRTVSFKVFLLELRRKSLLDLGVGWPGESLGALTVSRAGISQSASLALNLNHLEEEGHARILSQPELVVRAPGEAELFSGGQIPIRVSSQYFSDVNWKNHGLTLKIQVGKLIGRSVRLTLTTEMSHLTQTKADATIPGIESNRMKTEVDAKFGEYLLLSGLLKQNEEETTLGLPFLADIPLLGSLFGSTHRMSERNELVALLLPSLEPPQNPNLRIAHHLPLGRVPFATLPAHLEDVETLTNDPDYPWSAFREGALE